MDDDHEVEDHEDFDEDKRDFEEMQEHGDGARKIRNSKLEIRKV
jgi:hypothetical protein